MTATSLLGILGTIIGLVRALPQLVTMLRARRAERVSVDTAAVSAAAVVAAVPRGDAARLGALPRCPTSPASANAPAFRRRSSGASNGPLPRMSVIKHGLRKEQETQIPEESVGAISTDTDFGLW